MMTDTCKVFCKLTMKKNQYFGWKLLSHNLANKYYDGSLYLTIKKKKYSIEFNLKHLKLISYKFPVCRVNKCMVYFGLFLC